MLIALSVLLVLVIIDDILWRLGNAEERDRYNWALFGGFVLASILLWRKYTKRDTLHDHDSANL